MITQEQLSAVVNYQNELFDNRDFLYPREALHRVQEVAQYATIVTGIRRGGKSTLLHQLLKQRRYDILYLNFEDTRLAGFDLDDFGRLSNEITKRGIDTLFFDEIQLVKGWEIFIHQMLNENKRVFITGSNASLLSKEMGTHLTGRHLSMELFPFSYREFVGYKQLGYDEHSLTDYLFSGGIPDYVKSGIGALLNELMNDILMRDIAVRYAIRDISALRQLAVYLISHIGTLVSANKLEGLFGIKANSTILEYFSYFKDAYLLEFMPMFSYSLKTQARNPKKIYTTDVGLYSQNSTVLSDNISRRLENLIYIYLRQRFKEVYYFKGKGECDFVAVEKGLAKQLIQVCYHVDNMNLKRECDGLLEAMNFFGTNEGVIVTFDQEDSFKHGNCTIHLVPAYKFLANE